MQGNRNGYISECSSPKRVKMCGLAFTFQSELAKQSSMPNYSIIFIFNQAVQQLF